MYFQLEKLSIWNDFYVVFSTANNNYVVFSTSNNSKPLVADSFLTDDTFLQMSDYSDFDETSSAEENRVNETTATTNVTAAAHSSTSNDSSNSTRETTNKVWPGTGYSILLQNEQSGIAKNSKRKLHVSNQVKSWWRRNHTGKTYVNGSPKNDWGKEGSIASIKITALLLELEHK